MSETDTLTRVMWYTSVMVIVAAVALAVFAAMGPLQGPATMPTPPSATNYSATN